LFDETYGQLPQQLMHLHYYGHREDEHKLPREFATILATLGVLLSVVLQGRWGEVKKWLEQEN
jgi:hypothetical protein